MNENTDTAAVATETKPVVHIPLKTSFTWTGDGYGSFNAIEFTQVKRVEDVALFERKAKTGRLDWEVIKVGRHNGYELGGQYVEPAETYPGSSQFGKSAWHFNDLALAEIKFDEVLSEMRIRKAANEAILAAGGTLPKRGRPKKIV